MPTPIIAFDFGTKRMGVAACTDWRLAVCSELSPIRARDGIPDWPAVESVLREWQPSVLLVGLPLASDGSDMEITRRARKFGRRLHGRFQIDVAFVEETLTTRAAKDEAMERGLGHDYRKQSVDSIAARLILETWLGEQQHT